jgi:hypothetical protein
MLATLCLTPLISGVISVSSLNLAVDTNNKLVYNYGGRTQYVLPDKFSLIKECRVKTRFVKDAENPLTLISSIE